MSPLVCGPKPPGKTQFSSHNINSRSAISSASECTIYWCKSWQKAYKVLSQAKGIHIKFVQGAFHFEKLTKIFSEKNYENKFSETFSRSFQKVVFDNR